jgi:hypothetical protein
MGHGKSIIESHHKNGKNVSSWHTRMLQGLVEIKNSEIGRRIKNISSCFSMAVETRHNFTANSIAMEIGN